MKKNKNMYVLSALVVWLFACVTILPETSTQGQMDIEGGDFADWTAWDMVWVAATRFEDVTVTSDELQEIYQPVEPGYLFLAMKANIRNISNDTQQMWFPQEPIYLTDATGTKYNLVGIAYEDTILTAPPYLITEDTRFIAAQISIGGHYTIAHQPKDALWFIEATPDIPFSVDFLFTIPENASGLVLQFGNGYRVDIK